MEEELRPTLTNAAPVLQRTLPFILVACLLNLLEGGIGSMLAPFYPLEAGRKDLSQTQYGLVLGAYAFGLFLFTPTLAPAVIAKIGLKRSMSWGMTSIAVSSIAFAFLDVVPAGNPYFAASMLLQLGRATGSAVAGVALFAVVMCMQETSKIMVSAEADDRAD